MGQIADVVLAECAFIREACRNGKADATMRGVRRQLTIEQARELAEDWEAEKERYEYEAALAARFRDAKRLDVIRMWDSGKNEKGKRLTKFEAHALAERWAALFGCLPPSGDEAEAKESAADKKAEPTAVPGDDEMLNIKQVAKLTTMSESTIKRRVQDGLFPKPIYLSERRKAWPARAVKRWLDELAMS